MAPQKCKDCQCLAGGIAAAVPQETISGLVGGSPTNPAVNGYYGIYELHGTWNHCIQKQNDGWSEIPSNIL